MKAQFEQARDAQLARSNAGEIQLEDCPTPPHTPAPQTDTPQTHAAGVSTIAPLSPATHPNTPPAPAPTTLSPKRNQHYITPSETALPTVGLEAYILALLEQRLRDQQIHPTVALIPLPVLARQIVFSVQQPTRPGQATQTPVARLARALSLCLSGRWREPKGLSIAMAAEAERKSQEHKRSAHAHSDSNTS